MKTDKFTIVYNAKVEKDGKGYFVYFPDVAGVYTDGKTVHKALQRAREVLQLCLVANLLHGYGIPKRKYRKGYEVAVLISIKAIK